MAPAAASSVASGGSPRSHRPNKHTRPPITDGHSSCMLKFCISLEMHARLSKHHARRPRRRVFDACAACCTN